MTPVTLAERFRRWFEYERVSHGRVLHSLDTVPEAERGRPEYTKAVDLLAHIVAARRLWLHRMGASAEGPASTRDLFPRGDRDTLAEELERMHADWAAWLDTLDDAALAEPFTYRSFEGEMYRNRVEDILAQLYGHSWYHRGQIASFVKACGGTPAVTDFVFWSRELIEP